MKNNNPNTKFIAERITELRLAHNLSEYKLSYDLGYSKGYIQSISSGNTLPSITALFEICDYFNITPAEFFSKEPVDSEIVRKLMEEVRNMSYEEQYSLYQLIKTLKKS